MTFSDKLKFKNEKIYILISKNHKSYKKQVKARTVTINGIKIGIVGNSNEGYSLTHIDSGMAFYFDTKLKNIIENIPEYIRRFENLPKDFIEKAIKEFEKSEILEEI